MRERVHKVARRLGYTSDRIPVRDSLLALMVSGIGNPYNAALIRGVESQARAAGSSLVVGDIADGPEVELAHIQRLIDREVDGIVLASSSFRKKSCVRSAIRPMLCCSTGRPADSPASPPIRATAAGRSSSIWQHWATVRSRICPGRPRYGPTPSVGARFPKTLRDWVSRSPASVHSCRRSTKDPRLPMSESAAAQPLW